MTGYCNRCGVCCTLNRNGRVYVCEHLIRLKPLGEPNATLCSVHGIREHGMPITLKAEDGSILPERCIPDFPGEADKLPKECSYVKEPANLR